MEVSQSMFGVPCTVLRLPILAHSTLHHLAPSSVYPSRLLSTQESGVFGKQILYFPEVKNKMPILWKAISFYIKGDSSSQVHEKSLARPSGPDCHNGAQARR